MGLIYGLSLYLLRIIFLAAEKIACELIMLNTSVTAIFTGYIQLTIEQQPHRVGGAHTKPRGAGQAQGAMGASHQNPGTNLVEHSTSEVVEDNAAGT